MDIPENKDQVNIAEEAEPFLRFAPGQNIGNYTVQKPLSRSVDRPLYLVKDEKEVPYVCRIINTKKYGPIPVSIIDAGLEHKSLLLPVDSFTIENGTVLIFNYIKANTLTTYQNRHRKIDLIASIELAIEIASALQYLKSVGILHRNLHADNIFITEYGTVKVGGIFSPPPQERRPELIKEEGKGKIEYFAPEALKEDASSQKEDIYSFGAVLYFLTTGKPPYHNLTPVKIIRAKPVRDPMKPRGINRDISDNLEELIERCMNRVPQSRCADFEEIIERLRNILKAYKISSRKNILTEKKEKKIAVTVGFLLISLITIFLISRISGNSETILSAEVRFFTKRIDPWGNSFSFTITNGTTVYNNDGFRIEIISDTVCYLYIFLFSPDGTAQFLYPPGDDFAQEILREGVRLPLPGTDRWYKFDSASGTEYLYIVFVKEKWDRLESLCSKYIERDGFLLGVRQEIIKLLNNLSSQASRNFPTEENRVSEYGDKFHSLKIDSENSAVIKIELEHK